jgi:hypothetical protein
MVEVWRGVPLAVVRVGKQLKSWSPSLSCCSGPWNVGVGQPSKLVAQQARVAVAQPGCRKLIVVAIAMAMLVTDGKGSVGDAQMVHDFARLGPSLSLSLSLSPSGLEYSGQICGRVSVRDKFLESGGVWLAVGTQGWSWHAELRVLLAWAGLPLPVFRPATLSRLAGQCPLMGICT